ncbi:phosphotransferase [Shimia sp.]|uniref:phosphotransferase family protein n=1 Tax=Shimia sp. TaxID=1954381 RepID=UPI0032998626
MLIKPPISPPLAVHQAVQSLLSGDVPFLWHPLSGGRTNSTWLGTCKEQNVVVKLYTGPSTNLLFPNDPQAEAQIMRLLGASSLVPKLLGSLSTPAGRCTVYSHIPGKTWSTDATLVGVMMRNLHHLVPPAWLRKAPNGSSALIAQTRKILDFCSGASELIGLTPEGGVPEWDTAVMLHCDIVPGNLIVSPTGLHLIDWQCPAFGDPCEDIAIFLSPAMQKIYRGAPLSSSEISEFFEGYANRVVAERYRSLASTYHWRMAAYCLWQSQNGREDYQNGVELEIQAMRNALTT